MATIPMQSGLAFPVPLTEKYRPRKVSEFIGIDKPKAICAKLAANPMESAWVFKGPSGTGKTSIALALADEMNAELHHIPSSEATLDVIKRTRQTCQYFPQLGKRAHLVLCDEADQMSPACQNALLSILDATNPAPNTVWIFTANSTDRLEPRFLSRCHVVEFSSYGICQQVADLLSRIWDAEVDDPTTRPNFERIVKNNQNNVRGALMSLETELFCM
jgi:replication-associated recombination protein RarA